MELLAAVVRDAWRQCARRPLAVVSGSLFIGGSPDMSFEGSREIVYPSSGTPWIAAIRSRGMTPHDPVPRGAAATPKGL